MVPGSAHFLWPDAVGADENIIEPGRLWGIEIDRALRFDSAESSYPLSLFADKQRGFVRRRSAEKLLHGAQERDMITNG
jgi:hypothetical protein